jgi:hypothetical protein
MNAASDTTKAISQGFVLGFHSWSAWVSMLAAALIPSLACDNPVKSPFGFHRPDERRNPIDSYFGLRQFPHQRIRTHRRSERIDIDKASFLGY